LIAEPDTVAVAPMRGSEAALLVEKPPSE